MSVERTIVQKLFESKGLCEASFEAGGSTYKCVFGKYYKNGEEISRDEYFSAREKGNGGSSKKSSSSSSKDSKVSIADLEKELADMEDTSNGRWRGEYSHDPEVRLKHATVKRKLMIAKGEGNESSIHKDETTGNPVLFKSYGGGTTKATKEELNLVQTFDDMFKNSGVPKRRRTTKDSKSLDVKVFSADKDKILSAMNKTFGEPDSNGIYQSGKYHIVPKFSADGQGEITISKDRDHAVNRSR